MKRQVSLFITAVVLSCGAYAQYDAAQPTAALQPYRVEKEKESSPFLLYDMPLSTIGQCTWYPSVTPNGVSHLFQVYELRGQWALMKEVELSEKKAWVFVPLMGGCWIVPGK